MKNKIKQNTFLNWEKKVLKLKNIFGILSVKKVIT